LVEWGRLKASSVVVVERKGRREETWFEFEEDADKGVVMGYECVV